MDRGYGAPPPRGYDDRPRLSRPSGGGHRLVVHGVPEGCSWQVRLCLRSFVLRGVGALLDLMSLVRWDALIDVQGHERGSTPGFSNGTDSARALSMEGGAGASSGS